MTLSTPTEVTPVPLEDLRVQIYKSLRTAALTKNTGEVLAQCTLIPNEPAEHLQYRLLSDALAQRSTTAEGERALGIVHRGKLTVEASDARLDYELPGEVTEGSLQLVGDQVLHDGDPLPRSEAAAAALKGSDPR